MSPILGQDGKIHDGFVYQRGIPPWVSCGAVAKRGLGLREATYLADWRVCPDCFREADE